MANKKFGKYGGGSIALALALAAGGAVPGRAQQAETPAPAPSSGRTIDFRLPPAENDGRAPGVQGPSNNGIAPSGPNETRPTPTPTPTPAPTPSVPRVTPTQPAAAQPSRSSGTGSAGTAEPARRAPPSSAAASTPDERPAQSETPDVVPDITPDAGAGAGSAAAPAPAPDTEASPDPSAEAMPAAAPAGDGTPVWAWLLALLAAGAAGVWYWRRRPVPAGGIAVERSAEPRVEPPAPPRDAPVARPKAAPAAAPAPAPRASASPVAAGAAGVQRAPSPLVTRPSAERRAIVALALEVRGIRVMPDHIAVAFALNLANQGSADATGLMVRIALNQGSAMTEPVLGRFFDGAGGSVLRDNMNLAVGAGEALTTEAMLPRAIIEPLMIGGKPMLVPVMAFDVTYHWEGDADAFGQVAGSFVLGREPGSSGSDKLAPLPLDRASYTVDRPGSRSTAVRRSQ